MNIEKEVVILITEDDVGHAQLIEKNLLRSGIRNTIVHFSNGQEVLDYLARVKSDESLKKLSYVLLLDIHMPRIDGIDVLKVIKSDPDLQKIPVIMITTTDNPAEVQKCHELGCNNYITKPIDYDKFIDTIHKLGLFLMIVEIPNLLKVSEAS